MSPMQNNPHELPADLDEQITRMRDEVKRQEESGQFDTCAHEMLAQMEQAKSVAQQPETSKE